MILADKLDYLDATGSNAEAIDFDGTNDYLSRSSDLVGNADGKTFTFSAWFWYDSISGLTQVIYGTAGFRVYYAGSGELAFVGNNVSATVILSISASYIPREKTFNHVLISCDLSNTANRYVYINDINVTSSVTFGTYTNDSIDFTQTTHAVAANQTFSSKSKGRLAHVYLDYTYRDLSVTANRRLFVTADLKPAAGQASLNPILYLKMDDPTTAHINAGTGGNFTLNGTVARSGRGPNQFNVPYSDFDGAADYLSKTTALTGVSDGQVFTVSFCLNQDDFAFDYALLDLSNNTSSRLIVQVVGASKKIMFYARNAAGTGILSATVDTVQVIGRNYHIVASVDLSNSANRSVYINGVAASVTWGIYTNDTIDFSMATPNLLVGKQSASAQYFNGRLGALWFNTSYIDLSVPANLAKFVTGTGIDAKPVDLGANGELPTGTAPLIYLPMYGNNAGKNYGTGGDFTVNSGPYPGARGPNEFWGNKAQAVLYRTTALSGVSDSKTISGAMWLKQNVNGSYVPLSISANGSQKFRIVIDSVSTNTIGFEGNGGVDLSLTSGLGSVALGTWLFFCFDMSNSAKRFVYQGDTNMALTVTNYNNTALGLSASHIDVGAQWNSTSHVLSFNGVLAQFYLTTEYIDFSVEANRLKFKDAFGNPVDLGTNGSNPTGNIPPIYLRYDPNNGGANSGNGGAFSIFGALTDGGQL